MPPPDNWSAAERLAWAPAERLTPSQWAERYAVIPDNGINPEPGPLSLDRTPYFRGVLDAIADPLVEELVFLKPTQVGYSTLLRVLLGYWIDADPGPCLVVLPDELSAKEWLDEDVRPTLEQTERLARHLSSRAWDTKKTAIKLASMSIFAAWAGSPQRLARRPIRYGLFDEIDKYPPFSGREADPISLALKRLSNWGKRARAIFGSTPTVRDGNIWKRFQACPDKRYYQIPCPHCEVYQRLIWPQVKGWRGLRTGDKVALANEILIGRVAYYECAHCHEKIEDRHKPRFLLKGNWASEGQTIDRDGTIRGERVRSTRIGFGLNSLYSPWLSFSTLAAEWVMAEGDLGATMDFRNSREAMPFEIQVAKTRPSHVRDKVQEADAHGNYRPRPGAPEPLVVPKWAVLLLATADTQGNDSKDGWFPWVIRAWGYGLRSQLVHFGIVSTFEELQAECLDRQFPIEGGGRCQPQMLLIDAGGNRWSEVMQFCGSDRVRIHPTKGNAKPLASAVHRSHLKNQGLVLWLFDPDKPKDLLNRLIHDPDPAKWMPNTAINDAYCNELAAEHKIIDPQTKQAHWVKVTEGTANHYLDCEAAQCAVAFDLGMGQEPPEPPPQTAQADQQRPGESNWANSWRGRY
jgi:phage terminase large subunit GpA-like protein